MANGTVKPISEVKAGDMVLTAEPGKKEKEKHKVKEVIVTKTDRNYVDVVVKTDAGPQTIETTKHHQFYEIIRNSWTQAGDLKPGQELQDGKGEPARILDVIAYTAERTTYDLSVEGLHTYHALAGATPMLVHNCQFSDRAREIWAAEPDEWSVLAVGAEIQWSHARRSFPWQWQEDDAAAQF
ncbi:polymorphic toxin-type HINT domain-containing protein [Streptomyces cyaneofuscatus]